MTSRKLTRRSFGRRTTRRFAFALPPAEPLDLVKPPRYEPPELWLEQAKVDVERLIDSLKPGALDAGSREVLHNLINARVDQALADLEDAYGDRLAIAAVLVAMASEEVARRRPSYDVDVARASHATAALADAYAELTGRPAGEFVPAGPNWAGHDSLYSPVGPINLRIEPSAAGSRQEPTAPPERDEHPREHH